MFGTTGVPFRTLLAQVDLQVGDGYLAVFHRVTTVADAAPVLGGAAMQPAALGLHLPLALDAQRAVGQGVEPDHRNPRAASLALAVSAGLELPQGTLDLGE